MGSSNKWLLAGAGLVGLAVLMWYGDRAIKTGSESFGKGLTSGLKFPDLSVTMPSFNPTVTMPNISLQMPGVNIFNNDLQKAMDAAAAGVKSNIPGLNGVMSLFDSQPAQVPTVNRLELPKTTPYNYQLDLTQINNPNMWSSSPGVTGMAKRPKSTSEGGNSIFVENGENDYYVEDKSLYGGNSGMPTPEQQRQQAVIIPPLKTVTNSEADFKANEAAIKAEAMRKIEEFEKKNNVVLPRTYKGR